MKKTEHDTWHKRHIVCPWCGYEHTEVCDFGDSVDVECWHCEKPFHSYRYVEITYTTKKIQQPTERDDEQ